jgi:phosphatidylserine synthase 2
MGQHCWLLLATIMTEILVITKWSKGMFSEPLPAQVQWGWFAGVLVLMLYPAKAVSL